MHGGDIYRNKITYDFSVNINPLGIPKAVQKAMVTGLMEVTHYPDMLCASLKKAIAQSFGDFALGAHILCGNGASELLMGICHELKPKVALLAAPCFSGYEHALRAVDCKIKRWYAKESLDFAYEESLMEEIVAHRPEIVILANPSNPVGAFMQEAFLNKLLATCEEVGCFLLLDECFVELSDQAKSMVSRLSTHKKLLILRAFTKSFAIPGIRLGYLLSGDVSLLERVESQLPEWNVSSISQIAGVACLQEMEFLKRAVFLIIKERDYLEQGLQQMGIRTFSSKANFLLFYWHFPSDLYECLLQEGILIRDCSDYEGLKKGYYRIAVRSHEENEKLLQAIQEILENGQKELRFGRIDCDK